MMEFMLSKVWVFFVGIALLAVLVQGVQVSGEAERMEALDDVAYNIQEMLFSIEGAGPGLERTIHMSDLLPGSTVLIVLRDHAILCQGDDERIFNIPEMELLLETESGLLQEKENVTIAPGHNLLFITGEEGLTMIVLDQQSSQPDT